MTHHAASPFLFIASNPVPSPIMRNSNRSSKHGSILSFLVFLLLITSRATAGPSPWGFNFRPKGDDKRASSSWSSMLTVDPSKIVALMVKHGGLLIPESSKKDLKVFAKVCHAQEVKLNVVEKRLVVHNFTVHLPDQQEALRIGRVALHWDSYLRPCVEIEVDDVYIMVEFFNVLFSKNNW
jgi:hypothetical protein